MTHFYEFTNNVPNARRKMNAEFVMRMKKACCRHHCHVETDLNNDGKDTAYVQFDAANDALKHDLAALCLNYGFGKEYVTMVTDADTNKCTLYVGLNKPL